MSETKTPITHTTVLDPENIAILPGNPNAMGPEEFAMLCGGIKRLGFLQPLTVRPVRIEDSQNFPEHVLTGHTHIVTDGEHRLRAVLYLKHREVPVLTAEHTPDEAAIAQISMNRLRGQLDMTAVGGTLDRLVNEGWVMSDLEIVGFSTSEITSILDAVRHDPNDDLTDTSEPPPDLSDRPRKYALTFDCGSDALRAKVRAALLEHAPSHDGEDGTLLEGLLKVLELD